MKNVNSAAKGLDLPSSKGLEVTANINANNESQDMVVSAGRLTVR